MANSYIRIYDKPNDQGEPATWLGLSATPAYDLGRNEDEFFEFFAEQGHSITEVDLNDPASEQRARILGGVSWKYFEVIPPFSEELFPKLGELCAKLVDPGDDSAFLVDNRHHPFPLTPASLPAKVIRSWE